MLSIDSKFYFPDQFPMGEISLNVSNLDKMPNLTWHWENDREIFRLILLANALYNHFGEKPAVLIPYLPYSRQDGVRSPGDPNSLKVFLDTIKPHFSKISSWDIHNPDAAPGVENISTAKTAVHLAKTHHYDYLVCPDEGAKKRFAGIEYPTLFCSKKRDTKTGKLSQFEYLGEPVSGRLLIYDDICDGGGTFLGIRKLFPNNEMGLFVTHGGFTKSVKLLTDVFDLVFATNSFSTCSGVTYVDIL